MTIELPLTVSDLASTLGTGLGLGVVAAVPPLEALPQAAPKSMLTAAARPATFRLVGCIAIPPD